MVSYCKSSKVLEYVGCLNLSKLKEMERGSKVLSGRDDENIDSTENVNRG